jgi:hypothetical protein
VEPLENALQLRRRDSDSLVADAQHDVLFIRGVHLKCDIHVVARIFHGVVEQVGNGRPQSLWISLNPDFRALARGLDMKGVLREAMPRLR